MQSIRPRVLIAAFPLVVGTPIVSCRQLPPGIALGPVVCLCEAATSKP